MGLGEGYEPISKSDVVSEIQKCEKRAKMLRKLLVGNDAEAQDTERIVDYGERRKFF
jgi:hypothetical protein